MVSFAQTPLEQLEQEDKESEKMILEKLDINREQIEKQYEAEISAPTLQPCLKEKSIFPSYFSNLYIGMSENELLNLRPNLVELNAPGILLRKLFYFVSGRYKEYIKDEIWGSAYYATAKRKLAGVNLSTLDSLPSERRNECLEHILNRYYTFFKSPITIKPLADIRGTLHGTVIEWKLDCGYVRITTGESSLILLQIGSHQISEKLLRKLHETNLTPTEELRVVVQSFPNLTQLLKEKEILELLQKPITGTSGGI